MQAKNEAIKPETSAELSAVLSVQDVEARVLALCQGETDGIGDSVLQVALPNVAPVQRAQCINNLLAKGKIEILRKNNALVYRYVETDTKCKGFDREEMVVYQVIERAGNKGIWVRDIRSQSGLVLSQVNKVLKALEGKKAIKAVKSVAASKKKLYMLYNLEPDRSITGGAWYSGQEFESEFVEVLNQQCYRFLMRKATIAREKFPTEFVEQREASFARATEISKFIEQLGISKVQLSVSDVEVILNTLMFDGKVEKTVTVGRISKAAASKAREDEDESGLINMYRAIPQDPSNTCGLSRMPCGMCPVKHDCTVNGLRSPGTCQYFRAWLDDLTEEESVDSYDDLRYSLLSF